MTPFEFGYLVGRQVKYAAGPISLGGNNMLAPGAAGPQQFPMQPAANLALGGPRGGLSAAPTPTTLGMLQHFRQPETPLTSIQSMVPGDLASKFPHQLGPAAAAGMPMQQAPGPQQFPTPQGNINHSAVGRAEAITQAPTPQTLKTLSAGGKSPTDIQQGVAGSFGKTFPHDFGQAPAGGGDPATAKAIWQMYNRPAPL